MVTTHISFDRQLDTSYQIWNIVAMFRNIFVAFCCFGGSYLRYYIAHYLKNKPPGFKTILDCQHIQLLQYWTLESVANYAFATLYEFEVTSWTLSWIVGFGGYLVLILTSLHLFICLVFRVILIFYHHTIEEIPDKSIMKITR